MSGTATVPNTFANAVTATGAQLDANYDTIVAFVNDPTNRNNYAVGGAATNTVVLSFAPPVVGGYTAGLELTWKWGTTNSGAVVLNANGLGDASVVNPDGTALQAGQGTAGSIGKAVYDGTRFIFLSSSSTPASAAQVSAAASLVTFVSPGRVQNHPGVAKAWAVFVGTSTGTIAALSSHNVASIVRVGTGTYGITMTTPMASADYAVIVTSTGSSMGSRDVTGVATTSSFGITVFAGGSGAAEDRTRVQFIVLGNQ